MSSQSKIIDKVVSQDKKKQDKTLREFADAFINKLPQEDIDSVSSGELAEIIKQHWALGKSRKKGDTQINVTDLTLATKQGGRPKTVIDVVCDDMAFTINSVAAELTRRGYKMKRFFHPRLQTEQEAKKARKQAEEKDDQNAGRRFGTSHLHIVLDVLVDAKEARSLKASLENILKDVALSNKDWPAMLDFLRDTMTRIEQNMKVFPEKAVKEHQDFLNYLYNDNFTLLGTCEFDLTKKKRTYTRNYGLLSEDRSQPYLDFDTEGMPLWTNIGNSKRSPLIVTKLRTQATVHRIVPLDAVSVTIFDEKSKPVKELVMIGLFTSVTYSRSIQDVPYLRQKADAIVQQSGFMPAGHDYKALRHILERFPRDELFQIDEDELARIAMDIMRLQQQPRIALFTRNNPFNNLFSCLVYIPREQFDTRLRLRVQKILEDELDGVGENFYTTMDDSILARVLFIFSTKEQIDHSWDLEGIEKKIQENCRPWADRFAESSEQLYEDPQTCARITRDYGDAFPSEYRERVQPKHALYDVTKIEEAFNARGGLSFDLYRSSGQSSRQLQLKIYRVKNQIPLSDILPILENMGLRVMGERPYEVKVGQEKKPVWIHDFLMEFKKPDMKVDLQNIKPLFEQAIARIWFSEMDNDGLNKLILNAGMNWREVTILRAYIRYLHQIRYVFSLRYMEIAATENPKISRFIVDFFKAWHDPANGDEAKVKAAGAMVALDHAFNKVESLDYDRILRRITEIVDATLRTNFFQTDQNGEPKTYLSIKLDSRKIKDIPSPKPYREIFVYSPRVEAIHLRGDKIARGGIRWSDRLEDFRTEVLGLMKAQLVKNSIIVPMGAKGGFVVRRNMKHAGREQIQKEGIECYKIFISGLLDITDNIVDGKIVPPDNVVRRDEDDPYLVVAADKGTATFSDIANQISKHYNFWMQDAFASGGAAGYDHKKMGITARGAWESVKRHFQELNHNTQTNPFRVVGVGDMGGDVFGNGMLLSKHILLNAAFNHRHIFVDPDPDPAKSWKERKRLFDNVLGWDHYNKKLLSKGARIYDRSDKSIELTPEIQKLLGLTDKKMPPQDLIRSILKSDTDLIWFGGIGTYIKARTESHLDVGDKSNDAVRINADEIRAKVIGEGANLAVTQAARVEAALKGIRLNADFIDNSGGVDCSDHEVNIKILLHDVVKAKKLSLKARNTMLEDMTDEIAEIVLRNNYQQALGVSLMELQSYDTLNQHREFINDLENAEYFTREQVGIPGDEDLEIRFNQGKGLTRPELAMIQAYAKILFTQDLLKSDIPDSENMTGFLTRYFPERIQKKYADEILDHSLRREIIATEIANGLMNRMGPTFVKFRMLKTGASSESVARAYIITREAFDLRSLWDRLENLDFKVPAMVQLKAMREIANLVEREVGWFLTRMGRTPDIDKDIPVIKDGIEKLKSCLPDILTPDLKETLERTERYGIDDGLPKDLAREIAMIPVLGAACDIIRIANSLTEDVDAVARVYFEVGGFFHLDWLRNQARFMAAEDKWLSEAKDGIIDQLYTCQAGIASKIIMDTKGQESRDTIFSKWLDDNRQSTEQIQNLLQDMRKTSGTDISMLIIAEQRLRSIFGG